MPVLDKIKKTMTELKFPPNLIEEIFDSPKPLFYLPVEFPTLEEVMEARANGLTWRDENYQKLHTEVIAEKLDELSNSETREKIIPLGETIKPVDMEKAKLVLKAEKHLTPEQTSHFLQFVQPLNSFPTRMAAYLKPYETIADIATKVLGQNPLDETHAFPKNPTEKNIIEWQNNVKTRLVEAAGFEKYRELMQQIPSCILPADNCVYYTPYEKMADLLTPGQWNACMEEQGCHKSIKGRYGTKSTAFREANSDKSLAEKIELLAKSNLGIFNDGMRLNEDGTVSFGFCKSQNDGSTFSRCHCTRVRHPAVLKAYVKYLGNKIHDLSDIYCGCCLGHWKFHLENATGEKFKINRIKRIQTETGFDRTVYYELKKK